MVKVRINSAAPEFTLQDYRGNLVSLSHFKQKQKVMSDIPATEEIVALLDAINIECVIHQTK